LFGLTLGNTNPASPDSFLRNLATASFRSLLEAFFGGVIFNLGNLLLVAAISVAGMAVAFPIGAGLALVIGAGSYILPFFSSLNIVWTWFKSCHFAISHP
jgi:glucose uptake protein